MSNIIEGRNAVYEALSADRAIEKILIAKSTEPGQSKTMSGLISLAKSKRVAVSEAPKSKLDELSETGKHQGIIAFAAVIEYADISDILALARKRGEDPLIIILDHINDPHNLGAIIRTAETAGAHGVVIPNRRAATVTSSAEKAAAGAASYIPVAKVANIASTIDALKKEGVWVYCATMGGTHLYNAKLTGAAAVVIGSEGEGVSQLIRKKCDFEISIPMYGNISSLNASVSAGIILYEIVRQRRFVRK